MVATGEREDLVTIAEDMAMFCHSLANRTGVGRQLRNDLLGLKARWDSAKRWGDVPLEPDDIPLSRRLGTATLTPKQMALVEWFHAYRKQYRYSPTMQELADALGTSKVTVYEHVHALVAKGVFRINRHKSRGVFWRHDFAAPVPQRFA